jgi:Ca2+-binding RTX toxin-like protein
MAVIVGNDDENTLIGTSNIDTILGKGGDDLLKGGGGDDALIGGTGADTMYGGQGNDIMVVDDADDEVVEFANQGIDWVEVYYLDYTLPDHVENLLLIGSSLSHQDGTGNALNNHIIGNAGVNYIDGKGGMDVMEGGGGNDQYVVDIGTDQVVEEADGGIDTIHTYVTYTLPAEVEGLTMYGTASINAFGNAKDNWMDGNSGNNIIYGYGGDDTLRDWNGSDTLYGGEDDDAYYLFDGGDTVIEYENQGHDTVWSNESFTLPAYVEDLYLNTPMFEQDMDGIGNGSANRIEGTFYDNLLDGKGGADTLIGAFGADTLVGGSGADTFVLPYLAHTGITPDTIDVINDFNAGEGDKIDVHDIDANVEVAGNQAFTFIGTAAYSGAGQIRVVNDGIDTYLAFSTDSDPDNDGTIKLLGLVTPDASWFVL